MSKSISRWFLAAGLVVFLVGVALAQDNSALVGHWRETRILGLGGPLDSQNGGEFHNHVRYLEQQWQRALDDLSTR